MKPTAVSGDCVSERENAEEGTKITVLHGLKFFETGIHHMKLNISF